MGLSRDQTCNVIVKVTYSVRAEIKQAVQAAYDAPDRAVAELTADPSKTCQARLSFHNEVERGGLDSDCRPRISRYGTTK